MRKCFNTLTVAVSVVTLGLSIGQAGAADEAALKEKQAPLKIGLLLETYDVARWARDEEYFTTETKSLGGEVLRAVANGDQDKQNQQADTLLTQGAKALVVVPRDLKTAGRIIKSAHANHAAVLAYDRLILNCDLDMYVTFDNERVGYLQARGVLDKVPEGSFVLLGGAASDNNAKLLRVGQLKAIKDHETATGRKITVLDDGFLDNWDKDEARRRVSSMLTRFKAKGLKIDAIIASNDSTAGGAIAALKAEKLDGKVAVSGQDAELAACQRVVEGTQTVTVYKPIQRLATTAAAVAIRLAKGEKPEDIAKALGLTLRELDNGTKKVPSLFLDPIAVTKENMKETVIKDKWQPEDKVYSGVGR